MKPKRLDCPVEYTRAETIRELDGWLNRGKSFYPIDTALSAVFWLERSKRPDYSPYSLKSFDETLRDLRAWIRNTSPHLPESLGEEALHWLLNTEQKEAAE